LSDVDVALGYQPVREGKARATRLATVKEARALELFKHRYHIVGRR